MRFPTLPELFQFFDRSSVPGNVSVAGGSLPGTTERGGRSTFESQTQAIYRKSYANPQLYQAIIDIRRMHKADGRVKQIHRKTVRAAAKGGVVLKCPASDKRLHREFLVFAKRLGLGKREKLQSDLQGLMMEGNLPIQWVLDKEQNLVGGIRMPSESILPQVNEAGRIEDVRNAYHQMDFQTQKVVARFALWQLTVARLDPENYDDWGCMGRPYLDATRSVWKKLCMTEEDLVVRRRMRAPLRMNHSLENADDGELKEYREEVENDSKFANFRDFFSNKKSSVTAIQGDTNLDQIADVVHLLDTFHAGAPAPKALFGYPGDLSRDVLEDLKQDWYDEIDALQDNVADVYQVGFGLHLLLKNINPDNCDFTIEFKERRTETRNQRADLGLKIQAGGASRRTVWETMGLDPQTELKNRQEELDSDEPYPLLDDDGTSGQDPSGGGARVSITPGNQRRGESGTAIATR